MKGKLEHLIQSNTLLRVILSDFNVNCKYPFPIFHLTVMNEECSITCIPSNNEHRLQHSETKSIKQRNRQR